MNLAENESRLVGMKFKALDELSNPDISGLGIIPEAQYPKGHLRRSGICDTSSEANWNYCHF
jgi:hypothetical protein